MPRARVEPTIKRPRGRPKTNPEHKELLGSDYEYYARVKLKIIDKAGDVRPLTFNPTQKHIWKEIAFDISENQPVRIIVLKPRQNGVTTLFAGMADWVITQKEHKKAMLISHQETSGRNILNIFRFFQTAKPESDR